MTNQEKLKNIVDGLKSARNYIDAQKRTYESVYAYANVFHIRIVAFDSILQSINDAIDMLKAREPKPPVLIEHTVPVFKDYEDGTGNCVEQRWSNWHCPNCKGVVGQRYKVPSSEIKPHDEHLCDFCPKCGQAIDWSDRQ